MTFKKTASELYDAKDKAAGYCYALLRMPPVNGMLITSIRDISIGSLVFKRSASGLRVTCYLHFYGQEIVSGAANGGGYDRHSAAFADALSKLSDKLCIVYDDSRGWDSMLRTANIHAQAI